MKQHLENIYLETKLTELNVDKLYPRNKFPDLWWEGLPGRWKFKYGELRPKHLHTIWRGINPNELKFIMKKGFIKSNQRYNIGYEVTMRLTVYAKSPGSAINYAAGFAPEEFKPTEENPNYLLTVDVKGKGEEFGLIRDPADGYIKTKEKIPNEQIKEIREVRPGNKLKMIYSKREHGALRNWYLDRFHPFEKE